MTVGEVGGMGTLVFAMTGPRPSLTGELALEPLDLGVFPLMMGQRSVSGSPVGSPATIDRMLAFARLHDIRPQVEVYPMSEVNDALDHLKSGEARYRVVLSNA